MSTTATIFLATSSTPAEAAEVLLAHVPGLHRIRPTDADPGDEVLVRDTHDEWETVTGVLTDNFLGDADTADPREQQVFDGHALQWSFSRGEFEDRIVPGIAALFDDLTTRLDCPLLLTLDERLLAASDHGDTVHFPPDTFVDVTHRQLWERYRLTRADVRSRLAGRR